jgi:hypothetical protein
MCVWCACVRGGGGGGVCVRAPTQDVFLHSSQHTACPVGATIQIAHGTRQPEVRVTLRTLLLPARRRCRSNWGYHRSCSWCSYSCCCLGLATNYPGCRVCCSLDPGRFSPLGPLGPFRAAAGPSTSGLPLPRPCRCWRWCRCRCRRRRRRRCRGRYLRACTLLLLALLSLLPRARAFSTN